MGIISFESFALVLFVVVLAGILWILEKTSEAGRNIMATLDSPPVKSDEQQVAEDLAFRRRMVHQADLEQKRQDNKSFRGLGVTPHDIFEINGELHEGPIHFANMEPFCGEGKKP